MVCGSGALASSPPPPPIRAVRASSQASLGGENVSCRDAAGGCAAGGCVEVRSGVGAGRGVCAAAGGCGGCAARAIRRWNGASASRWLVFRACSISREIYG